MQSYRVERIQQAFRRSRLSIGTIALTYALSVLAGCAAVHGGSTLALGLRDRLVGRSSGSP
jgi:hypothetical protein